ncbi:10453_t:CDS:2 [Dentiscutata erythropus]|uniref:10453_t:CDS:1 n=1 Tax=Dentiscutata erythropus TaxID=1348616 RepID=A0A9N8ZUZ0_9GLOM|nr:10453_t:CDS:2 [Dentiscutata erythropus]
MPSMSKNLWSKNIGMSIIFLVLAYALQVTISFNWCVKQFCEVEANMNSVERLVHYSEKIEVEAKNITPENRPPAGWPAPSQLISWLLKGLELLVELEVENQHWQFHSLDLLKQLLEDPVLFNGTIRSNLDPFNEHSDLELWNALHSVHLIKNYIPASEKEESEVIYSISDQKSDKQEPITLDFPNTLREEFKDSTVIIVAHRLRTVIDCDKILVMDAGNVVEFDIPYLLMQKSNGWFRGICDRSGEFAELMEIAKQKYEIISSTH